MVRSPAVSGQFYPARPDVLCAQLQNFLPPGPTRKAFGVVVPHAGYVFSGAIAGATFSQVTIPDRIVIIGPNHHGFGHRAAVFPDGGWETPLGIAPIDADFAHRLLESCPHTGADTVAHRLEHSLEVLLPFLQILNPSVRIVPLCLGHLPLPELLTLGECLGDLIRTECEPTLVVASSDMTHYEHGEIARLKDMQALEKVLALDPEGLYRVVRNQQISMCGVLPTVVMLAAAHRLRASAGELVRYGNSGDVTGDQREVVGYAGVAVWAAADG